MDDNKKGMLLYQKSGDGTLKKEDMLSLTCVINWKNPSYYYWTPLHIASANGNLSAVEILLSNNADVNSTNGYNQIPLHFASDKGHESIVTLLLNNKANINMPNNDGKTPLHRAAYWGKDKVIKILLNHQVDVNLKDKDGDTPLHNAVGNGYYEIVKALLDHQADVNLKNKDGQTPLHLAACNRYHEIVKVLLNHQADVNLNDKWGRDAIALSGKPEVKQLLLNARKLQEDKVLAQKIEAAKEAEEKSKRQEKERKMKEAMKIKIEEEALKKKRLADVEKLKINEANIDEIKRKDEEIRRQIDINIKMKEDFQKKEDAMIQKITLYENMLVEKDNIIKKLKEEVKNLSYQSKQGSPVEIIDTNIIDQSPVNMEVKLMNDNNLTEELSKNLIHISDQFDSDYFQKEQDDIYEIYQRKKDNNEVMKKQNYRLIKENLLAIRVYTYENCQVYKIVNSILRDCFSTDENKKETARKALIDWKLFIFHLQSGIINLAGPEERMTIYRGQQYVPDDIVLLKKGQEICWPGFTSCSEKKAVAMEFAKGQILFEIEIEPNQGVFLNPYTVIKSESEILLPAFCKFKIVSIQKTTEVEYLIQLRCLYIDTKPYWIDDNTNEPDLYSPIYTFSRSEVQKQSVINTGGQATVRKATLNVIVALKEMTDYNSFKNEIQILSKLNSPHIIHFFGILKTEDHFTILMEHLPDDLEKFIMNHKEKITEQQKLEIALDIIQGLSYLHQNGIVHSDLKSSNVLLTIDHKAKICDFGASKLRSLTSSRTLIGNNAIGGTYRWDDPNYLLDDTFPKVRKPSDIYSYGLIVWQLFSFQTPYPEQKNDPTIIRYLMKAKETTTIIPHLLEFKPEAPALVINILKSCFQWEPIKRPTATELVHKLGIIKVLNWKKE